jgi:hypothetical protein
VGDLGMRRSQSILELANKLPRQLIGVTIGEAKAALDYAATFLDSTQIVQGKSPGPAYDSASISLKKFSKAERTAPVIAVVGCILDLPCALRQELLPCSVNGL